MSSRRYGTRIATLISTVFLLVVCANAFGARHDFAWEGWLGGTKDSQSWNADNGDERWTKEGCHFAPDPSLRGGDFTVEVRRERGFQPDVSLGVKNFSCNAADHTAVYPSSNGGGFHFRFPWVERGGSGGISGRGHVEFPL